MNNVENNNAKKLKQDAIKRLAAIIDREIQFVHVLRIGDKDFWKIFELDKKQQVIIDNE